MDTGAYFDGYHGDSCITVCVGDVSEEARKLSRVAQESLMAGLSQIRAGNTLLDIAGAVEDHVKANQFSVVEDYTGHGVGRNLHEEPSVFNFRTNDLPNVKLRPGMTLAVEPILNAGSNACRTLKDRLPAWGKRASWAHQNSFESFGLHAPAALLALIAALQTGPLPAIAAAVALIQPVLRLIYIGAYVSNIAPLRGLCWASALFCTGILNLEGLKVLLQSA